MSIDPEVRWVFQNDQVLSAKFQYIQIAFEGIEQSPLGYELLEALRPGKSVRTFISLQKKIFGGLLMMLTHESRYSENGKWIQLGRAQVTALF